MAKIRLIENDTWLKFHEKAGDLKLTSNALLSGLLGDHDFKFKNLETIDAIGEYQKQNKDMIAELVNEKATLTDKLSSLEKELIQMAEEKLSILAKNTKLVAKQKETIQKKNEKIKDYRSLVSSMKKDNNKLTRQIKALTVVEDSEEEEDGDSESGVHGPSTEL